MEIKWKPAMGVGEKIIDSQHKALLDHINKLIKELSPISIDLRPVRETLHFLSEYANKHFSYEERYMQKNNYIGLNAHKKLHQIFIQFFESFKEEFKSIYTSDNINSIKLKGLLNKAKTYLGEWLVNHILTEDQKYAKYIKTHSK